MDIRYLIAFPEMPGEFRVLGLRIDVPLTASGKPPRGFKAACRRRRLQFERQLQEMTTKNAFVVVRRLRANEYDTMCSGEPLLARPVALLSGRK